MQCSLCGSAISAKSVGMHTKEFCEAFQREEDLSQHKERSWDETLEQREAKRQKKEETKQRKKTDNRPTKNEKKIKKEQEKTTTGTKRTGKTAEITTKKQEERDGCEVKIDFQQIFCDFNNLIEQIAGIRTYSDVL